MKLQPLMLLLLLAARFPVLKADAEAAPVEATEAAVKAYYDFKVNCKVGGKIQITFNDNTYDLDFDKKNEFCCLCNKTPHNGFCKKTIVNGSLTNFTCPDDGVEKIEDTAGLKKILRNFISENLTCNSSSGIFIGGQAIVNSSASFSGSHDKGKIKFTFKNADDLKKKCNAQENDLLLFEEYAVTTSESGEQFETTVSNKYLICSNENKITLGGKEIGESKNYCCFCENNPVDEGCSFINTTDVNDCPDETDLSKISSLETGLAEKLQCDKKNIKIIDDLEFLISDLKSVNEIDYSGAKLNLIFDGNVRKNLTDKCNADSMEDLKNKFEISLNFTQDGIKINSEEITIVEPPAADEDSTEETKPFICSADYKITLNDKQIGNSKKHCCFCQKNPTKSICTLMDTTNVNVAKCPKTIDLSEILSLETGLAEKLQCDKTNIKIFSDLKFPISDLESGIEKDYSETKIKLTFDGNLKGNIKNQCNSHSSMEDLKDKFEISSKFTEDGIEINLKEKPIVKPAPVKEKETESNQPCDGCNNILGYINLGLILITLTLVIALYVSFRSAARQ